MRRLVIAIIALAVYPFAHADSELELLKHPWPYQASVTVSSDRHKTPPDVADAVHTLVMSQDAIGADSSVRELVLGAGVGDSLTQGFGLPLADSFWLVGDDYSVFRRGATPGARLELNTAFADHIDSLFRQGKLDSLHTFGTGEISREQASQALGWLAEEAHRRPTVWVSHSFSATPSGSEPGVHFLSLASKNLVKGTLRWIGDLSLTRALADRVPQFESIRSKLQQVPKPYRYPTEAKWTVIAFHVVLGIIAIAAFGLLKGGWAWRVRYGVTWALLSSLAVAVFFPVQLNYSTGDNPDSPRYNIDLVNGFGMNYHWFIIPRSNYLPLVFNKLSLREHELEGRRTFFQKVALDNGNDVMAFPRNSLGPNGMQTLELLTDAQLTSLQEKQGVSILYTHWFEDLPGGAFSEKALAGLGRLRAAWQSGDVWVAPSGQLLDFHFVRTFLDFETRQDDGLTRIEIKGVDSPINGLQQVSRDRLAGLSFAGTDAIQEVQVWHDGAQIPLTVHTGPQGRSVWQIP